MHRELSEGGISLILDSQIDRANGSIICPEDDGEKCWEVLLRIDNHLACLLFMIASEAILEEEGFEVGIVLDQYAVRLTPENTSAKGFIIDRASVSVVRTWDSENGGKIKYTFTALKPKTGKMLKQYN